MFFIDEDENAIFFYFSGNIYLKKSNGTIRNSRTPTLWVMGLTPAGGTTFSIS